MVDEAIRLLLLGMGTVFAFLGLLVGMMMVSGRMLAGGATSAESAAEASAVSELEEQELAVAIAVAHAARRNRC